MSYEERKESGIMLKQFGGAYRLVTKADFAEDIKRLLENPSPKSMTQASLEVLAIIAYRQPVTRVEIDDLRGVKSEGPINTLIAKGLIMEKGRSEGSGRAILLWHNRLVPGPFRVGITKRIATPFTGRRRRNSRNRLVHDKVPRSICDGK